mgnify:CR=1 FL=1|tara:strand:- start:3657 stop:4916 length:1260 start_codon:yes stop_codon:yes gene_type:complete
MKKSIKKLFFKSEFNRNVLKLISGSAIANVINFLAIPILCRIYSVEEFGYFQLLFSMITILGVISCLKYEMTLTLTQNKKESDNLFFASVSILIIFSIILFFVVKVFGEITLSFFNANHLNNYIYWICPGVFSLGLYELLNYVFMRKKAFGKMAKFRFVQVLLIQLTAIAFGIITSGFEKLLFSFILGNLIVSTFMIFKSDIQFQNFDLNLIIKLLNKFKKFPIVNMPMALLNTFSMQLPVFILSTYFNAEVIGFYMMANRILTTPMQLISRSVGRVYYKEASDAFSGSKEKLKTIFKNTVSKIAKIGLLPVLVIIPFAPILTKLLLGNQWEMTGIFMQIMMPWIYFQFINLPVSTTFSIINRQEIGLILIIISIILRYTAMVTWSETPIQQITVLTIVASLFYITYIYSSFILLREKI